MGLDFKSLREKLNRLQGQDKRSSALWKPPAGQSIIRIVPWVGNKDNPFIELYFHYLGNKTYLSPLSYGRPDPIAEFADKLKATGEREDWQQSRQFAPKLRTYVPVVVRGEEAEGVKFWSFGKTVYTELLAIIDDPDYGDITDPQAGRDITVNFTPQKDSDTNFAKTDIRIKPSQTPITKDVKLLETVLRNQPTIKDLFVEQSYEELKDVLQKYLDPSTTPSVTQQTKTPAAAVPDGNWSKPVSNASSTEDVTEAFDKLFSSDTP